MARRLVLALGLATYVAAWAFGSRPLYPVATGLVLAVVLSWVWVGLANRPMRLRRSVGEGEHLEGDDVRIALTLERSGGLSLASISLVERIAKLGERTTPLSPGSRGLRARYVLSGVPRGRYAFEDTYAVIEDPFGLQRIEVPLAAAGALLVYPRLVELDRLFSEAGAHSPDGRRLLLQRPSGFDLHSVREYERGESLRKVHWRSTAKRGQLMVKELEDAPRDEIAVLLDASSAPVVGEPPDSSFDVQVRAAGSILKSHASRGRRAVLVVNGTRRETQRVHSLDGDWRQALELLAAAEPTGTTPLAALLADEAGSAARALELAVVTSAVTPKLADHLLQRMLTRRSVSLVFVDVQSFNGADAARTRDASLLRLQAAGVPVAVLRAGDDLASRLSGERLVGALHG